MAGDSAVNEIPDPDELAQAVTNIATKSQAILREFMREHGVDIDAEPDPFGLLPAFLELAGSIEGSPGLSEKRGFTP